MFQVINNRNSCPTLSLKEVFSEILLNSQESTCVGVSFLVKLQLSRLQL